MKHNKAETLPRILFLTIRIILYAAAGILVFYVWKLNMLPNRYFLLLSAAVILISLLVSLLLNLPRRGKWMKKTGYTRQIIGCVLCLLLTAGYAVGIYAAATLDSTITSITTPSTVHVLLDIYVRADDPAQYVQDTASYTFGVAEDTAADDLDSALAELKALTGSDAATVAYPSAFAAIDALLDGQVDAIILDSSYLSILDSLEGYSDFEERARQLHEHVIEKEVPVTTPDPTSGSSFTPGIIQLPKDKDAAEVPFLLYISGNDARREYLADGGSDVNILVVVNPADHQILLINTPRDYYVVNPASGDGSRDKLSHCGLKGIDNCIGAITDLYGQPIHYYARINFSGFRTLVDAIGGVTVNVDVPFSASRYYFREGENYLDGDMALAFARERKNLAGGDNDRGKNQMKLITAMIRQLSSGSLLKNYGSIMESLEGMFTTSMSAVDIAKLVQLQLSEMPEWEIFSFAVTGDNGTDYCWAARGYGYVMYPHEHMVAHASGLIEKVLNGERLTQEDLIPPQP